MAKDANPHFRVNVYGNDPGRLEDMERTMAMDAPRGGGGGFPWFRGARPSPTYPTTYTNPSPVEPVEPVTPEGPAAPPGGIPGWLAGLSPRDKVAIMAALAGTIGGAASGRGQNTGINTPTSDPNLQALMQAMQRRLEKSEPLYDSVLNMANGLLPTQYQKGGGGMG